MSHPPEDPCSALATTYHIECRVIAHQHHGPAPAMAAATMQIRRHGQTAEVILRRDDELIDLRLRVGHETTAPLLLDHLVRWLFATPASAH